MADEPDPSKLDATWGGFNVAVRGSIVVLACLIIADTAGTIWFQGYQSRHFDDVTNAQNHQIERIQSELIAQTQRFAEAKERMQVMQDAILREQLQNRSYIREVAKVCLLSDTQRLKVQQTLSSSLRELLMDFDQEKKPH